MFAILRCENNTLLATIPDAGQTYLACTMCRSKKLKCSREKGGCMRCLSRNIECIYPDAALKKAVKRKRLSLSNVRLENPDKGSSSQESSALVTQSSSQQIVGQIRSSVDNSCDSISPFVAPKFTVQDASNDQPSAFSFSEIDFFPAGGPYLSDIDIPWDLPDLDDTLGVSKDTAFQPSFEPALELEYSSESLFSNSSMFLDATTASLSPQSSADFSNSASCPPRPNIHISHRMSTRSLSASCQCTSTSLSLITTLITSTILSTISSVPTDLRLNKHILSKSRPLLICPSCKINPNSLALLILLAEKIVQSYDGIVQKLIERYNQLHPNHPYPQKAPDGGMVDGGGAGRIMPESGNIDRRLLRDYEVDVEEEPCVFGGLVQMQLRALRSFLHKLKVRTYDEGWAVHRRLVEVIEENLVKQLRICGSCGEDD